MATAPVKRKPRNRRLDPTVRKNIILDKTAELIAKEGVSAVSMERVGREAGVSKPLVYAYFPNQMALLRELLIREQKRLFALQAAAIEKATNFEELIRFTTRTYLKHVEESGVHVQRLMNEPSISEAFEELDRKDRQLTIDFLAKEITSSYGVPRRTSSLAAEVAMGMTGVAGELISRGVVTRKKIEEINICLAMGSINGLRDQFGKKLAKGSRK